MNAAIKAIDWAIHRLTNEGTGALAVLRESLDHAESSAANYKREIVNAEVELAELMAAREALS